MKNYENNKILVTGASSGIGRALAIKLAEENNRVVLCARDEEKLNSTRNEMKNPQSHICIPFDLNDFSQYDALFNQAVSDGVKINGLVHCAGVATPTPARALNSASIMQIMNTNYVSFMCLAGMYSKKKYAEGGSIVGISAINAHYYRRYMSVYAGSKAAVEASVGALAIELADKNIRVNCVVPGAIETEMAKQMSQEDLDAVTDTQLFGMGQPEQVADAIIYLLSDNSSFMTGRTLYVDGGRLGQ